MVKIQAFQGYTYPAEHYDTLLKFNHQTLNHLQEYSRSYISRTKSEEQIYSGLLQQDVKPFFYVYSQKYMNKLSYGILAQVSLQDFFTGNIKVHEKTLCRQGLTKDSYKADHVGPIVFSYRTNESYNIKNILCQITQMQNPYTKWTTVDGRMHTLWKIDSDLGLEQLFFKIPDLYVLDGHHRLKASIQNFENLKNIEVQNKKHEWIQALIYPPEQVTIHPFHRVIQEIPEKINIFKFFEQNKIKYDFMENVTSQHLQVYDIVFKNCHGFYGLNFEAENQNCIEQLSVCKLKSNILDPIYGLQLDQHLRFVPGVQNLEDLISSHPSIFLVKSIKIEQIFTIADECEIMPPKSTWFEPKPCNKMVIRLPY